MDHQKYEKIRPLTPSEVPVAIQTLLHNPELRAAYEMLGMSPSWDALGDLLSSCQSVADFKTKFSAHVVRHIMSKTCSSVAPLQGTEGLQAERAYTYISNHRDIILDSAFLNVLAYEAGLQYPEIAIGDNLLVRPWVEPLVKLNGNFLVKRNLQGREVLLAAKELSSYMNDAIADNISLWIAQREGRAKDSDDRTQPALLKMLSLAGTSASILGNLLKLNLIPLTCSYEYDPCDYLKAMEMQQKRDNPNHKKTPQDDALNMRTGVMGYKGRVELRLGRPLEQLVQEVDWTDNIPQAEYPERIAQLIDKEMHRGYRLYPVNYIAWDMLTETRAHADHYTDDGQKAFSLYLEGQLSKITLPQPDVPFLTQRILEMYANPAINYHKALES